MTVVWRGLFIAAVLLQLVVLYVPLAPGDGPGWGWEHLDKVVHIAVFAAVAWAGRAVGFSRLGLAVVLVAHAGLSELIQHLFLASRSGDVGDVLADVAGVAIGLVLPVAGRARRPDGQVPASSARAEP